MNMERPAPNSTPLNKLLKSGTRSFRSNRGSAGGGGKRLKKNKINNKNKHSLELHFAAQRSKKLAAAAAAAAAAQDGDGEGDEGVVEQSQHSENTSGTVSCTRSSGVLTTDDSSSVLFHPPNRNNSAAAAAAAAVPSDDATWDDLSKYAYSEAGDNKKSMSHAMLASSFPPPASLLDELQLLPTDQAPDPPPDPPGELLPTDQAYQAADQDVEQCLDDSRSLMSTYLEDSGTTTMNLPQEQPPPPPDPPQQGEEGSGHLTYLEDSISQNMNNNNINSDSIGPAQFSQSLHGSSALSYLEDSILPQLVQDTDLASAIMECSREATSTSCTTSGGFTHSVSPSEDLNLISLHTGSVSPSMQDDIMSAMAAEDSVILHKEAMQEASHQKAHHHYPYQNRHQSQKQKTQQIHDTQLQQHQQHTGGNSSNSSRNDSNTSRNSSRKGGQHKRPKGSGVDGVSPKSSTSTGGSTSQGSTDEAVMAIALLESLDDQEIVFDPEEALNNDDDEGVEIQLTDLEKSILAGQAKARDAEIDSPLHLRQRDRRKSTSDIPIVLQEVYVPDHKRLKQQQHQTDSATAASLDSKSDHTPRRRKKPTKHSSLSPFVLKRSYGENLEQQPSTAAAAAAIVTTTGSTIAEHHHQQQQEESVTSGGGDSCSKGGPLRTIYSRSNSSIGDDTTTEDNNSSKADHSSSAATQNARRGGHRRHRHHPHRSSSHNAAAPRRSSLNSGSSLNSAHSGSLTRSSAHSRKSFASRNRKLAAEMARLSKQQQYQQQQQQQQQQQHQQSTADLQHQQKERQHQHQHHRGLSHAVPKQPGSFHNSEYDATSQRRRSRSMSRTPSSKGMSSPKRGLVKRVKSAGCLMCNSHSQRSLAKEDTERGDTERGMTDREPTERGGGGEFTDQVYDDIHYVMNSEADDDDDNDDYDDEDDDDDNKTRRSRMSLSARSITRTIGRTLSRRLSRRNFASASSSSSSPPQPPTRTTADGQLQGNHNNNNNNAEDEVHHNDNHGRRRDGKEEDEREEDGTRREVKRTLSRRQLFAQSISRSIRASFRLSRRSKRKSSSDDDIVDDDDAQVERKRREKARGRGLGRGRGRGRSRRNLRLQEGDNDDSGDSNMAQQHQDQEEEESEREDTPSLYGEEVDESQEQQGKHQQEILFDPTNARYDSEKENSTPRDGNGPGKITHPITIDVDELQEFCEEKREEQQQQDDLLQEESTMPRPSLAMTRTPIDFTSQDFTVVHNNRGEGGSFTSGAGESNSSFNFTASSRDPGVYNQRSLSSLVWDDTVGTGGPKLKRPGDDSSARPKGPPSTRYNSYNRASWRSGNKHNGGGGGGGSVISGRTLGTEPTAPTTTSTTAPSLPTRTQSVRIRRQMLLQIRGQSVRTNVTKDDKTDPRHVLFERPSRQRSRSVEVWERRGSF